jgi:predicted phosphodiesterase
VSAWNSDPDGLTAGGELEKAYTTMQKWHNAIPDMSICLGNHDIRHMSLAFKTGLSTAYLRHFNEIYDVDWQWNWSYLQESKVLYTHGSEKGGQYAHINLSKEEGLATVIGHTHAHAGVNWFKTRTKQWFALNVGCGIDESKYAFAYGQHKAYKCIIGAGLVLDHGNDPRFVPYEL